MSEIEIIAEFDKLSSDKHKEVFVCLAKKIIAEQSPESKPWLGRKLSFDEACEVVFRENRELLHLLAK